MFHNSIIKAYVWLLYYICIWYISIYNKMVWGFFYPKQYEYYVLNVDFQSVFQWLLASRQMQSTLRWIHCKLLRLRHLQMHLQFKVLYLLIILFPVGAIKDINILIVNLPEWNQAIYATWYITFHNYMRTYKKHSNMEIEGLVTSRIKWLGNSFEKEGYWKTHLPYEKQSP